MATSFVRPLGADAVSVDCGDVPWHYSTGGAGTVCVRKIAEFAEPPTFLWGERMQVEVSEKVVGRYRLIRKIGEGGMGAVYEAEHTKLKRRVALKLLPSRVAHDPQAVARFEREMQAAGRIQHPSIAHAFDADTADDFSYLAMEYIDGFDVGKIAVWIEKTLKRRLPVGISCEIVRQAAIAIHAAHGAGLIHRDIKPSNLMLTRDGIVKVLDLGLARIEAEAGAVNAAEQLTSTGQVMGTVDYMAPEQAADTRLVNDESDVYSLAATLYRLLAGQPPYPSDSFPSIVQKLHGLANTEPISLAELSNLIPQELSDIVVQSMAKDPSVRTSSALELAHALAPFAQPAELSKFAHELPMQIDHDLEAGNSMKSTGTGVISDGTPTLIQTTIASPVARQATPSEEDFGGDSEFFRFTQSLDKNTHNGGGSQENSGSPHNGSGSGLSGMRRYLAGGGGMGALFLGLLLLFRDGDGTIRVEVPDKFEDRVQIIVDSDRLPEFEGMGY